MQEPKTYSPATHWWLRQPHYLALFLREAGALLTLIYVVIFTWGVLQARSGAQAYSNFIGWLGTPPMLLLTGLILLYSIYHTVTWFSLTPKVQPLKIGKKTISGRVAMLINIVLWLVISLVVSRLILGAA